ncbi:MAG TPA: hypothetical protein VH817_05590 [Thermoleophilaceae bacterium]|jgi:hypothetical protein
MTRTRITRSALAAAVAAVLAAGVVATSGSAQAPSGTSLHLVSKQTKGGFVPKGRLHNGARFGFVQKISGDDTGTSRIVCTALGGKGLCTIEVQLSKGTLTAQGIVPERAHNTPVAVTGGTGAYNGARGTAFATDTSSSSSTIDVELLP